MMPMIEGLKLPNSTDLTQMKLVPEWFLQGIISATVKTSYGTGWKILMENGYA